MSTPRSTRHSSLLILLIAVTALVVAACSSVGSGGTLTPRSPDSGTIAPVSPEPSAEPSAANPSEPPSESETPATAEPTQAPSGATSVRAYLYMDGKLVPVRRDIDATRAVGRAALNALFEGPTAEEAAASPALTTDVPEGTILLGLDIADGLATVDLSREFERVQTSGQAFGAQAQVIYTLTQFPTVKQVAFKIDGEPITIWAGGDPGAVVESSDREDWQDEFLPSVFVERPTWGATIGNPVRVSGIANVFEAVFFVEVRDADGATLAKERVMASCGTGCWGTFDVSIPYDVSARQEGSVVTYNLSAKDGSVEDLRSYPVTLVP